MILTSYSATLSVRDSLKCRRLIESDWYQERWGGRYQLTDDQNQKQRFENDRAGYRIATSVGGSATGERADVVVVDDPHSVDQAASDYAVAACRTRRTVPSPIPRWRAICL